ncbi:MAG: response regulator [Myxococcales bacterium]|jgi:two-component system response regulator RegA
MPACTSSQGGALILLVDDDDCFRRALAIALRLEGHQVAEAGNAAQAQALVERQTFALALVDLLLGAERGEAVIEHIAQRCPSTRLASMTGRPNLVPRLPAGLLTIHLEKPLAAADVIALLDT